MPRRTVVLLLVVALACREPERDEEERKKEWWSGCGGLVDTLGVASFNVYRHLPRKDAMADALRLAGEEQVDVIGWQETRADYFPDVRRRLAREGWDTWQLWEPDGPFWLAVSWRRDLFDLVDGSWTEVHGGRRATPGRGIVVTLATGERQIADDRRHHVNRASRTATGSTNGKRGGRKCMRR